MPPYIIGESLKRLFRRNKEFKARLDKNHPPPASNPEANTTTKPTAYRLNAELKE